MRSRSIAVTVVLVTAALGACGDEKDDVSVEITAPDDGATVAGGIHVAMSADGITIEEAGEARDGAGHFHVIADDGCVEPGTAVPKDADHVHFGKGQTEGVIYLQPGSHHLCLQVADGAHTALDATDEVDVEVGISDREGWCAVISEVDELFETVDNSSEDLPVKQASYENIRRLLEQLDAAADVTVDAGVRADVHAALAFAANITNAFIGAIDEADVEERLRPIFDSQTQPLPASDWILEACGVDVNG